VILALTDRVTITAIVAGASLLIVAILRGSGFTFRAGGVAAELRAINKAVNNRPPHEPTVSDDVRQIAIAMPEVLDRLASVEALAEKTAARVGALEHPQGDTT
jgi:hypothetical protein